MPNLPAPGGADVWGADLNAAIESLHQTGTHAARPTTGLVTGTLYACTDHKVVERWDGTGWISWPGSAAGSEPAKFTHLRKSVDQSLPSLAVTTLTWDVESRDDLNAYTSGQPTRLTAPKSGVYEIACRVAFEGGTAATARTISFKKNGVDVVGAERTYPSAVFEDIEYRRVLELVEGDYIEAVASSEGSGGLAKALRFTTSASYFEMRAISTQDATTVVNADGLVLNGGLTLLKKVTLSAAAATIDLTAADLPEGYDSLMIDLTGRGDTTGTEVLVNLKVNGDTGTNYRRKYNYGSSTPAVDNTSADATAAPLGWITTGTATTGASGHARVLLSNYRDPTFHKAIESDFECVSSASTAYTGKVSSQWRNVAPITSLTLAPAAGNFAAGTVVSVYGVGGPGAMRTGVDPNEAWKDYTPTLTAETTNPTLGTGSVAVGRYTHVGNTVTVRGYIKFGTSGTAAGTGAYGVSLPKPLKTGEQAAALGSAWSYLPAGGQIDTWTGVPTTAGALAGKVRFFRQGTSAAIMGAAIPGAWGASAEFGFEFEYETDEYNPVVIPVAGSTSTPIRVVLPSNFTITTVGTWVSVTGSSHTFTPPADGVYVVTSRARLTHTAAADVRVRMFCSPAPVIGSAHKPSAAYQTANNPHTHSMDGTYELKAGVSYTFSADVYVGAAGTLTVESSDDYTTFGGLFVPKAVGIASSDQIPQLLASKAATASTTYSTTSSTDADIDAVNLAVTFVVPASGKVLIRMNGVYDWNQTTGYAEWTLREATTTVAVATLGALGKYTRQTAEFVIEGLTPGTTKTYKWGWRRGPSVAGTLSMYVGGSGGVSGHSVMEVWDAQPVRPATTPKKIAHKRRISGDITLTSTTFVDVDTALDLVMDAAVGDVIECSVMAKIRLTAASGSTYAVFDFHTIVAGAPVNSVSSESAASTGLANSMPGWGSGNVGPDNVAPYPQSTNGSKRYTVQAGDISGGKVTLRLRAFVGASCILRASDPMLYVQASNLGPVSL